MAKRLTEIGKKSVQDQKIQDKVNEDMRKMNEAAMKSYMGDISAGADMTSRAISAALGREEKSRKQVDPMMPPIDFMDEENMPSVSRKAAAVAPEQVKDPSLWCEARTEDGYVYYWNVKTSGKSPSISLNINLKKLI